MAPSKGAAGARTSIPSTKTKPTKSFKPPRPSGAAAVAVTPNASSSTSRRQSRPTARRSSPSSTISSRSASPSILESTTDATKRRSNAAETSTRNHPQQEHQTPLLPAKLLSTLLHHGFKDKSTRVDPDAIDLVGKYMDTFVREALARAKFEKEDAGRGNEDFLEVEDLERLAPQLVLDF